MPKRALLPLLALCTGLAGAQLVAWDGARIASASDCSKTSVGFTPLSELGAGMYKGYPGGLYPGGLNAPPPAHLDGAMARARAIRPLDAQGQPSPSGRVVLLSIGMSNATQEFALFQTLMRSDLQRAASVIIVDGAQGGQTASVIRNPSANFWTVVDQRLQAAGVTAAQVQALWLKEANAGPTQAFPTHAQMMTDDLQEVAHIIAGRFTNAKLMYLSSRIYGGYASTTLNPEPYAYETGFAVRWLIERQLSGDAALNDDPAKGEVKSPLLLWGPYLWADGLTPRADGLVWRCEDFVQDGTHPSDPSGRLKVANLLTTFFKTDPTTKLWFMADPEATPLPTPAAITSVPPRPTSGTPGTPPATPSSARRSYHVLETPSGDDVWAVSTSPTVAQRMTMISSTRPGWLCGRVTIDAGQPRGFYLGEEGSRLELDVPADAKTTIHAIQTNPAGAPNPACIQIVGASETRTGWPPGVVAPTASAPAPTATGADRTPTSSPTGQPEQTMTAHPPTRTATPLHEATPTPAGHPEPTRTGEPHATATGGPVAPSGGRLYVPWADGGWAGG